jgi:DNA-binding response OmpR family regulator
MRNRLLVVDDERFIAQALCVRLRAAGYEVHLVFDGTSGVAAAIQLRPDIIILDIRMPDIDGFEVNRRIKACPELVRTPVIFLSANVQESARQAAQAAGAHAFLTKPYEAKDLVAAIKTALVRDGLIADACDKETFHG